jgi:hypothetical protein
VPQVQGTLNFTIAVFLRAQRPFLSESYHMHSLVRLYHTTLHDMDDDDPAWRSTDGDPWSCDHDLGLFDPNSSCGEELMNYSPKPPQGYDPTAPQDEGSGAVAF